MVLSYGKKSGQIFLPFCHNACVWQTDGQREWRTDRILRARPCLHSIQRGKKQQSLRKNYGVKCSCNVLTTVGRWNNQIKGSRQTDKTDLETKWIFMTVSLHILDSCCCSISTVYWLPAAQNKLKMKTSLRKKTAMSLWSEILSLFPKIDCQW